MDKIRKFDTQVQYLNYKVLREVAKYALDGNLLDNIMHIPKDLIPGGTPTMRCCVYKERAILAERVNIAIGGDDQNKNVIEVIEIACDECPKAGYIPSDNCRGCISHRCQDACKKGAIYFDKVTQKAHIDKSKCVECGMCAKVCPYSAIINVRRPCETACKAKAISMDPVTFASKIDETKCVRCGACTVACPFGAVMSKSFIVDAIDLIRKSEKNTKTHVYAIVAPAITSQFKFTTPKRVVTGLKEFGFFDVLEVAEGADMVSKTEAKELSEKGFLLSSCCPAFVKYVKNNYPLLAPHISQNLSPAATLAKAIKEKDKKARVVFIGPCTAKKQEAKLPEVKKYIDTVLTFEELCALFDAKGIDLNSLPETEFSGASFFGRIFARTGGLSESVRHVLETGSFDFVVKPQVCSGLDECRIALLKKSKNVLNANFIEGMACVGGCVNGSGVLSHNEKNIADVNKFASDSQQ